METLFSKYKDIDICGVTETQCKQNLTNGLEIRNDLLSS